VEEVDEAVARVRARCFTDSEATRQRRKAEDESDRAHMEANNAGFMASIRV
jgi:hypothetical protein